MDTCTFKMISYNETHFLVKPLTIASKNRVSSNINRPYFARMYMYVYKYYCFFVSLTDYDAPLNEAGDPTTKYSLLRQVLVEHASDSISEQNCTCTLESLF